jgi:hypothetical protein
MQGIGNDLLNEEAATLAIDTMPSSWETIESTRPAALTSGHTAYKTKVFLHTVQYCCKKLS